MMRPHDMQADVINEIGALLCEPDLDAEELGRIVLTIDRFVRSGLITETRAAKLLAPRRGDRS